MVQTVEAKKVHEQLDLFVEMRDGIRLCTDIYRPDDDNSYPILLMRTPYNKSDAQTMNFPHPCWFAAQGFVVIIQDTRGRWKSEGTFYPLVDDGLDGIDTIEWAVRLPNVLPKVGLYGFSYVGMNQFNVAAENSPYIKCIAPFMCGPGKLNQGNNGLFPLAQSLSWAAFVTQDLALRHKREALLQDIVTMDLAQQFSVVPYRQAKGIDVDLFPFYRECLYDQPETQTNRLQHVNVPALHVAGWYDIYVNDVITSFNTLRANAKDERVRNNQYLIITPWFHMPWSQFVGQLDFGKEATNQIEYILVKWFNLWLKDDEASWDEPTVKYFITGENRYEQAEQWPVDYTVQSYYFGSKTKANSISGDGFLTKDKRWSSTESDLYVYHPLIPVPALGGRSGPDPAQVPMGAVLQNALEIRNDVLIFTGDALQQPLTITGEVNVKLFAATSAMDTDFVAKLIDVHPNGQAYNIGEGIIRASYANIDKPQPVIPNKVVEYTISLGHVGHTFLREHAIRIHITSTLFPTYARNPNDFIQHGDVTLDSFKTATQTIYHTQAFPSRLLLPVKA